MQLLTSLIVLLAPNISGCPQENAFPAPADAKHASETTVLSATKATVPLLTAVAYLNATFLALHAQTKMLLPVNPVTLIIISMEPSAFSIMHAARLPAALTAGKAVATF